MLDRGLSHCERCKHDQDIASTLKGFIVYLELRAI